VVLGALGGHGGGVRTEWGLIEGLEGSVALYFEVGWGMIRLQRIHNF
jgi:hypothetical protein